MNETEMGGMLDRVRAWGGMPGYIVNKGYIYLSFVFIPLTRFLNIRI